jgi:hypothetical protein
VEAPSGADVLYIGESDLLESQATTPSRRQSSGDGDVLFIE